MADQALVDVLKQGTEVWNRWRKYHADIRRPDLSEAILRGASLGSANLFGANLIGADLRGTDLRNSNLMEAKLDQANLFEADLVGAYLVDTKFTRANLVDARLSSANLLRADLAKADLTRANLRRAELIAANLTGANLRGADLTNAILRCAFLENSFAGWTVFEAVDLSDADGLDMVNHLGPSMIGIDTIDLSQGHISKDFLRGAGVPESIGTQLDSLRSEPIKFYSCFLSHSLVDDEFSERLRKDLLESNVSCWHYRHDRWGGPYHHEQISDAIKVHDKVVLICSKESLERRSAIDEISYLIERERETGSQKIFPIRLDDAILNDWALYLAENRMAAGTWREDWVPYVRANPIIDFTDWKREPNAYQEGFEKLVEALKIPARR